MKKHRSAMSRYLAAIGKKGSDAQKKNNPAKAFSQWGKKGNRIKAEKKEAN